GRAGADLVPHGIGTSGPLVVGAFFSATGLPIIVVITTIGVAEGRMRPVKAAALVAAGIVSVLVYPLLGLRQLKMSATMRDSRPEHEGG
ncbi:MAG TPA: hypothetical protein VED63_05570, partial [Acidimicrobiales bacterium]|nr:hypothetical protein [Acidimicrobiales bacterium]